MTNQTAPAPAVKPSRNREREAEIARTILAQLGGRMFQVMTGSKGLSVAVNDDGHPGLLVHVGSNAKRIKVVGVYLTPADLYRVEAYTPAAVKACVPSVTVNDVYAEDLRSTFTEITGLYTSLR